MLGAPVKKTLGKTKPTTRETHLTSFRFAPVCRSGKTTLLNRILAGDHGKRIVVIENEFGEIDIDSELVAFQENGEEDIMLINNGCICCSVRGDLVDMLGRLVIEKKGQFDHNPDRDHRPGEPGSHHSDLLPRARPARHAAPRWRRHPRGL